MGEANQLSLILILIFEQRHPNSQLDTHLQSVSESLSFIIIYMLSVTYTVTPHHRLSLQQWTLCQALDLSVRG